MDQRRLPDDLEHCFAELYEEFNAPIFAYCRRRFSREMAEDVFADVFAVAWQKLDQLPERPDQRLFWLYRIAYLTSSNQQRRLGRQRLLKDRLAIGAGAGNASTGSGPTLVERVVDRDELRRTADALAGLKPTDQEVLRLAAWEQLSTAEIADVLGISTAAASQRLHRARRRLTRRFRRPDASVPIGTADEDGGP